MNKSYIKAYYNQVGTDGFYEDTWEHKKVISNANDVFNFMKDCHLMDAQHRNNYPVLSCWGRWIKYKEFEYEVCNLNHKHIIHSKEIEAPDFHKEGKKLYEEWETRIKRTIPVIQKIREQKEKENKEISLYESLKAKYE